MEEFERTDKNEKRDEIFSQAVRAGKRTYFFDVKATRAEELYLTITESKRRFSNEHGRFFYDKHKIFLYKEDFHKFIDGLKTTIDYIETGKMPDKPSVEENSNTDFDTTIAFDDLGRDDDR
jgi:hypothetical protein